MVLFLFFSPDMQKFHHHLRCHVISINSSPILLFFKCYVFFKFNMSSLIWIIISRSSSLWLVSSRLIWLRSVLRIPISLQENMALPNRGYIIICEESSKTFLIILLVTNQAGINFNATRQWSTASSHILWVLHSS